MKIKINDTNRAAISAALVAANGKATAHTFTSASEIISAANDAEAQLTEHRLNKGDRAGVTACALSGGSVPSAYKYARTITRVTMVRGSADWFLTDVKSFPTRSRNGRDTRITLTSAQAAAVIAKWCRTFYTTSDASVHVQPSRPIIPCAKRKFHMKFQIAASPRNESEGISL